MQVTLFVHIATLSQMTSLAFLGHRRHTTSFWGAEGAPILFSDLGIRMASCSYIYFCHFANGGTHVNLYKA